MPWRQTSDKSFPGPMPTQLIKLIFGFAELLRVWEWCKLFMLFVKYTIPAWKYTINPSGSCLCHRCCRPTIKIVIFCHLLHIRLGKTGNLFSLLLCSLWWIQIVGYVCLADRTRLFVQYTISLSSLCKLSWRHWTYKMPVRYICVWVRLSIFSKLSIMQSIINYVGLCVFSLPIPLVVIERIYTLSYYHHQIGSMNYYPLFRVRSWSNGVRCMSFYILILLISTYNH